VSIPLLDPMAPRQLHPRIEAEPPHRISKSQRESMLQLARRDPTARMEGLDWKFRPVIAGRSSGPNGRTRYALQKNGDAAAITWANNRSKQLAEVWK